MDNLVMKTITFLFVPEAMLAVLFLFVFIAVFAVGIYWAKNCRRAIEYLHDNAEKDYEEVRAKMSPDLFIKKYLNKISSTEDKLEGIPEAFVSIGIVATFLGLGVAIQGSAELLENEKLELAKLTAVLGVIAFKFQTSVWGICFSLIFRSAIVERYFDFRQETVDYVNDLLYTIERDNIRTLLEKQNEFLIEQHQTNLSENRQLFSSLFEKMTAYHDANISENQQLFSSLFEKMTAHHNKNISESQQLFSSLFEIMTNHHEDNLREGQRLTDFFKENLAQFVNASQNFAETSQQFSNRVDLFKAELTNILQTGFERIVASNENFSKLHEQHIAEIHSNHKENMNELTKKLGEINSNHEENMYYFTEKLDELHQKFYLDAKRYVEETQLSLSNLLDATIGKVSDGYINEATEIRATVVKLNDTLSTIESRVNLTNEEFINRQKQFVNEWHGITEAVVKTLQTVAATVNENSTQVIQTYNNLQTITGAIQKLVEDNSKNLTKISLESSKYFNTAFHDFTKSVDSNLATLAISQKDNAENLKAITQDTSQKISAALEKFTAAQIKNLESFNSSQNALEKNLREMSANINEKFSAALENFSAAQIKNLESFNSSQNALEKNLQEMSANANEKFADALTNLIDAQEKDLEQTATSQKLTAENLAAIADTLKQILNRQEEFLKASNQFKIIDTSTKNLNIAGGTINTVRPVCRKS